MKEEEIRMEDPNDEIDFEESNGLNDLDFGGDRESESEEKVRFVEENLWEKLERVGKKISFAKDILALYNYMMDGSVAWQRKAIVVAALIYFITPIDAIPDIAPLIGYMDDLGVIAALLKFLGSELTPYYEPGYRA